MASVSSKIREKISAAALEFRANDNISGALEDGDLDALTLEVEGIVATLLDALVIDAGNDHNTCGTAHRVAKMLVHEIFWGRYCPRPVVTEFPNAKRLDEIYTLGPIMVRSACSHHLCPIIGEAWVGILPAEKLIGISKIARLCDWIMSRPQIQEEATVMLADELEGLIHPRGLGVVVKARHSCMTWRGVKQPATDMVTSVMRGWFLANPSSRAEFMALIEGQGFRT